jgi:lactate dehydrogenase-like 2-hydroxyacid dehydrogenase
LQDHELNFVSELKDVEIDAEIISIFIQSIIDARFLDQHQKIKLIVTRSSGRDHIDISTEWYDEPRIVSPDRIARLRVLMYKADLIGRPNVVFTPHIAFNSVEAVKRINQTTLENINAFLAGQPVNVVGK